MDINKDLVAASATALVLAILAEGDSYGYAIVKHDAKPRWRRRPEGIHWVRYTREWL